MSYTYSPPEERFRRSDIKLGLYRPKAVELLGFVNSYSFSDFHSFARGSYDSVQVSIVVEDCERLLHRLPRLGRCRLVLEPE